MYPIGGASGVVLGSTPYTFQCSGVPPNDEKPAAFGNSVLKCGSGRGLVKIRLVCAVNVTMVTPPRKDRAAGAPTAAVPRDRKSTRLNSSHLVISYAVFCSQKKKEL